MQNREIVSMITRRLYALAGLPTGSDGSPEGDNRSPLTRGYMALLYSYGQL